MSCRVLGGADSVLQGGAETSGALIGLCHNFARVFAVSASPMLFRDVAHASMSVDDVIALKGYEVAILDGLASLAFAQLRDIRRHRNKTYQTTKARPPRKNYER